MKKVLTVLLVLVVGFVAFVATRPTHFKVTRELAMRAQPEVVYAQVDDFHRWDGWSPWDKMDPTMQRTFSGPDRGVGATYAWHGNDKVGEGQMKITDAQLGGKVVIALDFMKPMQAHDTTTFAFTPHGSDETMVTWSMEGDNGFMGKAFGLFMNMDKMVGDDFERGLAALKTQAETEAKKADDLARAELIKQAAEAAVAPDSPAKP